MVAHAPTASYSVDHRPRDQGDTAPLGSTGVAPCAFDLVCYFSYVVLMHPIHSIHRSTTTTPAAMCHTSHNCRHPRAPVAVQVSSARMGKCPEDSVVDPNLRVHGVDGLRCVDASVFPTQVSGHPCAVVVAMAEKAADMIKASAADSS